jgi:ribosomal protein S18 acetylase RimI-like enzyme
MDVGIVVHRMEGSQTDALVKISNTSNENFWTKKIFEKHIRLKNHGGLVAFDNSNPVGYAAFERRHQDAYIQIWDLVVHPQYRRRGVGRKLVASLTSMVPTEFSGVRFNVRESNFIAHLFLKNANFWCDAIARSYFIDKTGGPPRVEDAYCFDYNTNIARSKNDSIRIISRTGAVLAGPRPTSPRETFYVSQGNGHR